MQENLILALFLTLLIVACIIGILRLLYAFLSASPKIGESDIGLTIYLKGSAEAEAVLRAAHEIRKIFFPSAEIHVICDSDFGGKALARASALYYNLDYEERN